MRPALVTPQQYRAFAAQCSRWAARAKGEQHKNMMLQMADHWMQTAQDLERADIERCVAAGAATTPPQDDTGQRRAQPQKDR